MRTLGPVDVLVNDQTAPAPLLWKKPLALALYLARSPRQGRTREHLVGLLWPEQPAEKAHGSLNEALRLLRRYGSRPLIVTAGEQVRIDRAYLDLDIDRFDLLVRQGQWGDACALVGGEFLEGFAIAGASGIEDWLRGERDVWRRKCVDGLLHYADQLMENGDLDGAEVQAQRAADLDRCSSAAALRLMRCLALRGLRTDALRVFDVLASRLATDLGTQPDAETAALVERVRNGRIWRRSDATDVAVPLRRRAPLVGRSRELSRLLKVWQACRTGRKASVALILGDPGMGKSRLAEELVEWARLDGAATAAARAIEADLAEPESGLLALADGGLLDAPGVPCATPAVLGAFAARLPTWAARFPTAPREGGPPIGRAFRDLALAVCEERPLVLLLDDAQWVDRKTLLALSRLARDLARHPCCTVVTATTHPPRAELEELRSRLGRDVPGAAVSLKPLTRDDLQALARSLLPSFAPDQIARITRRVATDSAGLALLAVELLQAVASGLELGRITSAWPAALRTLDQTLPGDLPDAIGGAIRVNYRRLSADAQGALAVIAVMGSRVPAATLRFITGLGAEALAVATDELEWQRWVTADPRGFGVVARIMGEIVVRDMVTPGQRQRIIERAQSPHPDGRLTAT